MEQLSSDKIQCIVEGIKANLYVRRIPSHTWIAEAGAFDDDHTKVRMFIWDKFCYYCISKMWIEDPIQNISLDDWMKVPWGTYPNLPPKPPKK